MKRIMLALGALLLASPAIADPAGRLNAPGDVAAIKEFELGNANQLDPAVLALTYAPDAVVLDYMVGGVYQGRAAITTAMTPQLAAVKTVHADIREQNIVTDGNFACDMLTTDFAFGTKDGASGKLSLRQMDALQKIAGKWQIVQEQIAAPEDATTGMAVTHDLQVRGDTAWPAAMSSETVPQAQALKEIQTWTDVSLRVVGIDAIMPYYGPGNDELAMYGPTIPGNVRGKAEMHAYYAPSMNSFSSLETKNPILKVDTDGRLGAQIDVQDITLHLRDGKTQALYWRQSDCVHRVGGKWYGILNMSSFPFDPKTGKSDSKWSSYPVAQGTR